MRRAALARVPVASRSPGGQVLVTPLLRSIAVTGLWWCLLLAWVGPLSNREQPSLLVLRAKRSTSDKVPPTQSLSSLAGRTPEAPQPTSLMGFPCFGLRPASWGLVDALVNLWSSCASEQLNGFNEFRPGDGSVLRGDPVGCMPQKAHHQGFILPSATQDRCSPISQALRANACDQVRGLRKVHPPAACGLLKLGRPKKPLLSPRTCGKRVLSPRKPRF